MSSTYSMDLSLRSANGSLWQRNRTILQRLYQAERKTLKELKVIMENEYGFPTTPLSTYESKLRELGIRKKLKRRDWHAIYDQCQIRGSAPSGVYLDGVRISSTRAWKEIRRPGALDGRREDLPRPLPAGIEVRTPSPGILSPPLPCIVTLPIINHGRSDQAAQPFELPFMQDLDLCSPLGAPWSHSNSQCKTLVELTPSYIISQKLAGISPVSDLTNSTTIAILREFLFNQNFTPTQVGASYISPYSTILGQDPLSNALVSNGNINRVSDYLHCISNYFISPDGFGHLLRGLFEQVHVRFLAMILRLDSPVIPVILEAMAVFLGDQEHKDDFAYIIDAAMSSCPKWVATNRDIILAYAVKLNNVQLCRRLLEFSTTQPNGYSHPREPQCELVYGSIPMWQVWRAPYVCAIQHSIANGCLGCARLLFKNLTEDAGLSIWEIHSALFFFLSSSENYDTTTRLRFGDEDFKDLCFELVKDLGSYVDDHPHEMRRPGARMCEYRYIPEFKVRRLLANHTEWWRAPKHLCPTFLDIASIAYQTSFLLLLDYSRTKETRITRWKLFAKARVGVEYLQNYLKTLEPLSPEEKELLDIIFAEQFVLGSCFEFNFDHNIAIALLGIVDTEAWFPSVSTLQRNLIVSFRKQGSISASGQRLFAKLLDQGAFITPHVLMAAVNYAGTELLEFLSKCGSDSFHHGASALALAIRVGNQDAVDWLINRVNPQSTSVYRGRSISFIAELLVYPWNKYNYGESWLVELRKPTGYYPSDHFLESLLYRGVKLCYYSDDSTPWPLLWKYISDHAGETRAREVIRYLYQKARCYGDPPSSLPCLLEACFLPDERSEDALSEPFPPQIRTCEFLLLSGVRINESGVLAFLIFYRAPTDMISNILESGVDINTYTGRGLKGDTSDFPNAWFITPLQAAAYTLQLDLVRLLVQRGADVNAPARGHRGMTALQAACSSGCISKRAHDIMMTIVRFLVKKGADINAFPPLDHTGQRSGYTAFQSAAKSGDIETASFLLDHGADINAPGAGPFGGCALDLAVREGRVDMTKFLLDAGALSDYRGDSDYEGAIILAQDERHWGILDLLQKRAEQVLNIRANIGRDFPLYPIFA
ncbi:hypothetical protein F5Y16DRAFT_354651 [Xylariaceae sp. FL0255]|nr:hypothetical protein F5Y16DRAFT_354651 [Xylariaceae sp. FL0255]